MTFIICPFGNWVPTLCVLKVIIGFKHPDFGIQQPVRCKQLQYSTNQALSLTQWATLE